MIVNRVSHLLECWPELGPGDVFVGHVPRDRLQSVIISDLLERGVRFFPSVTAQLLNTSKCAQATLLSPWMVPHTRVIARRQQLLVALTDYHRHRIDTVVTKANHLHCGHGVCKWDSLDALYSHLGLVKDSFPFVLQPFMAQFTDVRVIMAGDFAEAYTRTNPHNFRANLAAGGQAGAWSLSDDQRRFCHQVLARARFPYAHIDLMVTDEQKIYLTEIALNGGIAGAQIDREKLDRLKQRQLEEMIAGVLPEEPSDKNS